MGIKSECFAFICRVSRHQSLAGSTLFLVLCQHYFPFFPLPRQYYISIEVGYEYGPRLFSSLYNKITQLNWWIYLLKYEREANKFYVNHHKMKYSSVPLFCMINNCDYVYRKEGIFTLPTTKDRPDSPDLYNIIYGLL